MFEVPDQAEKSEIFSFIAVIQEIKLILFLYHFSTYSAEKLIIYRRTTK